MSGVFIATMVSLFTFMTPAQAAAGKCGSSSTGWSFCLYYNSGELGSYYRWTNSGEVSNLAGLTYPNNGNGNGAGQAVKNNSASASYYNASGCDACSNDYVRVFFSSGFLGNYDTIYTNQNKNLVNTYNNNASWRAYFL
ncbi:hypothetical protein ACFVW1_48175 [Streptomyces olivochromogenes]|uniref:hypothetical protein n=1 Tax=Streptomyces olivochromogenes TaxID=1963 RepID=UPI0036D9759A